MSDAQIKACYEEKQRQAQEQQDETGRASIASQAQLVRGK